MAPRILSLGAIKFLCGHHDGMVLPGVHCPGLGILGHAPREKFERFVFQLYFLALLGMMKR